MAEPSPVELVIKAVQTLPEAERDRALAWLVDRGAPAWGLGLSRAARAADADAGAEAGPPAHALHHGLEQYASLHGKHQVVLVRLPVDAHARLRTWCESHTFTMATVVRGLVDRFLDQQVPTPAED